MSTNDEDLGRFPFTTSFQFREDEKASLEAFFENVFFDTPIPSTTREAILRIRYDRAEQGGAETEPNAVGDAELAAPETEELAEDRRYVLTVRGADGIGKTRVFRHLRERARERQVPVYEIHNYDVEGIPLKPFLHAIRQIAGDAGIPDPELLSRYRYALEALLPEAFDARPPTRRGVERLRERLESDKVRIFDGITQLLLEVSRRRPLLILVQDLHWGDQATVELLRYIGRNLQLRNQAFGASLGGAVDSGDRSADSHGRESEPMAHSVHPGNAPLSTHAPRWVPPAQEGASGTLGAPAASTDGIEEEPLPSRLMLLANYRGADAAGATECHAEEAIARLGREPFAFPVTLSPLSRREADRFLARAVESVAVSGAALEVSEDAIDAVHELSEGFPSFQQELFRGVYLEDPNRGRWTAETFREWLGDGDGSSEGPVRWRILRRRLRELDPRELGVIQVLALARRPISAEGVARILSSPEEGDEAGATQIPESLQLFRGEDADADAEAHKILRRLRGMGLIETAEEVESASGAPRAEPVRGAEASDRDGASRGGHRFERFRFRLFDYVRVVEETIGDTERRVIHQRIGELFRGVIGDGPTAGRAADVVYEVYYHLSRGVRSESSVEFGLQAAERFERSLALEKAGLLLGELLELLGDDPSHSAVRLDVLARASRVAVATGKREAAEELIARFHAESASLSVSERFEVALLEAEAGRDGGDTARALKVLSKASRLVEDENSVDGARLQLFYTRVRLERQDWKRAINFGLKCIAIIQKLEAGVGEARGDEPATSAEELDPSRAAELAELLGSAYQLMARAFYKKGDYTHAVDNYQRALETAERLADRTLTIEVLDDLGRVYLERGNYFRAARYLYKALEERRRHRDVVGLCKSYDQLGLVYRRDGDYHKCIENLNRSLQLKERVGDYEALNPTLGTLGDLYYRLGDYHLALGYFRREVDNCRRLQDLQLEETSYLADSFCRQGFVHLEIGDLKRTQKLSKQVSILASEFKLRSQEADGHLLEGSLLALRRDWTHAERQLKLASEIYAKQGHRIRESSALLELAELKFQRELYDEALKLVSRGQIIADDVKALDLRVRALVIKGNVHRFLKGGNPEKVRELLGKALELSQNLNDVRGLFHLFYSFAKVLHSEKDYSEASSYYGKAEAILRRIGERLDDDARARYFEDGRRKVFAEDLERFRKEAQGRTGHEARERPVVQVDLREKPATVDSYKDLLERILRVQTAVGHLQLGETVLGEALELAGAERGVVVRVQNREYSVVAAHGFGGSPLEHPELATALHAAEEAIRRGKLLARSPDDEEGTRLWESLRALGDRAIVVAPILTEERIFGAVYLDRAAALGRFAGRDTLLLDAFTRHAAAAFQSHRQLDAAVKEPITGFYTPSYFLDRLREEYRRFNLDQSKFALVGYYLPVLEDWVGEMSEGLAQTLALQIADAAPGAAVCWGNPILYLLQRGVDGDAAAEIGSRVLALLEEAIQETVPSMTLAADRRFQQGPDMYFEIRRSLLPEDCDHRTMTDLRRILASDITLKEAKRILEKHIIEGALRKTGGNITHAAKELGLHRPQLSSYLKKYGLKREVYEQGEAGISPMEN